MANHYKRTGLAKYNADRARLAKRSRRNLERRKPMAKRRTKKSSKRKSPKRVAAGKKAWRTRLRNKARGKKTGFGKRKRSRRK